MTSKAKAIEVLQRGIQNYCDEIGLNYSDTYGCNIEQLKKELSKPTLDDCIAVVEKIENKDKSYFYAIALDDVLTALRGLKEGK